MNTIYTMAANLKPVNKTTAHQVVVDIIKNNCEPTNEQLASLYKYFMPPLPKKPKTSVEWTLKAVAKNDIRHYLNYAYAIGGYLYGSDGAVLHAVKTDLEEGFYDLKMNKVDGVGRYPDVSRFFTARKGETKLNITKFEVKPHNHIIKHVMIFESVLSLDKSRFDLVMSNPSKLVAAYQTSKTSYVRFVFEDASNAVLMPVKL